MKFLDVPCGLSTLCGHLESQEPWGIGKDDTRLRTRPERKHSFPREKERFRSGQVFKNYLHGDSGTSFPDIMHPERKIIHFKRSIAENIREMERKIDDPSSKLEDLTRIMREGNAAQATKPIIHLILCRLGVYTAERGSMKQTDSKKLSERYKMSISSKWAHTGTNWWSKPPKEEQGVIPGSSHNAYSANVS